MLHAYTLVYICIYISYLLVFQASGGPQVKLVCYMHTHLYTYIYIYIIATGVSSLWRSSGGASVLHAYTLVYIYNIYIISTGVSSLWRSSGGASVLYIFQLERYIRYIYIFYYTRLSKKCICINTPHAGQKMTCQGSQTRSFLERPPSTVHSPYDPQLQDKPSELYYVGHGASGLDIHNVLDRDIGQSVAALRYVLLAHFDVGLLALSYCVLEGTRQKAIGHCRSVVNVVRNSDPSLSRFTLPILFTTQKSRGPDSKPAVLAHLQRSVGIPYFHVDDSPDIIGALSGEDEAVFWRVRSQLSFLDLLQKAPRELKRASSGSARRPSLALTSPSYASDVPGPTAI